MFVVKTVEYPFQRSLLISSQFIQVKSYFLNANRLIEPLFWNFQNSFWSLLNNIKYLIFAALQCLHFVIVPMEKNEKSIILKNRKTRKIDTFWPYLGCLETWSPKNRSLNLGLMIIGFLEVDLVYTYI